MFGAKTRRAKRNMFGHQCCPRVVVLGISTSIHTEPLRSTNPRESCYHFMEPPAELLFLIYLNWCKMEYIFVVCLFFR